MLSRKVSPWSNNEVQTFLGLVAEERIQRELDRATRNEKVFLEIAKLMEEHGHHRTSQQCREKLKKLKCDYRAIKDHNGRSGSNRRKWRWFDQMDAIYGHRPASNGRESSFDSATALLERMVHDETLSTSEKASESVLSVDSLAPPLASTPGPAEAGSSTNPVVIRGKRKRSLFQQDQASILGAIHEADMEQQELNRVQRDTHIQMLLDEAREARELEAAQRREESLQTAAFNQAFLGVLSQLVQAIKNRV